MNLTEIATNAVDHIDRTLKKIIDAHELATHPEIINSRAMLIEKRNRMIQIVEMAINDAITADRMCVRIGLGDRVLIVAEGTYKGMFGRITNSNGSHGRWFVAIEDDEHMAEVSFNESELRRALEPNVKGPFRSQIEPNPLRGEFGTVVESNGTERPAN